MTANHFELTVSVAQLWLSAALWTAARQAPLPMGFSRQEYWSELPVIPFCRGLSRPRDGAQVPHTAGWVFSVSATREAPEANAGLVYHTPVTGQWGSSFVLVQQVSILNLWVVIQIYTCDKMSQNYIRRHYYYSASPPPNECMQKLVKPKQAVLSNLVVLCQYQLPALGVSLVVQWLRLHAFNAEGMGTILGWGTEIPHAAVQPKKKKQTHKTSCFW